MSGATQIFMAMMGGAPGVIMSASPDGVGTATATYQLKNDGTYAISPSETGNWVTPASSTIAAYYQVKVDVTLNSFSTGTTATWLDLSTTRTWTLDSAGDLETVTFDVSFREKASGIVRRVITGVTLQAHNI